MTAHSLLVLDRHAGDLAFLQRLAGSLGLVAIEAGEARPIVGLVALGDRLGERIGAAEQALGLALRLVEVLLRLGLGAERADLNAPAHSRRRARLLGLRLGRVHQHRQSSELGAFRRWGGRSGAGGPW